MTRAVTKYHSQPARQQEARPGTSWVDLNSLMLPPLVPPTELQPLPTPTRGAQGFQEWSVTRLEPTWTVLPPARPTDSIPMSGYNAGLVDGGWRKGTHKSQRLLLLPFPPEDRLMLLFTILSIVTVDPDIIQEPNYAVACVCPPSFNCYLFAVQLNPTLFNLERDQLVLAVLPFLDRYLPRVYRIPIEEYITV